MLFAVAMVAISLNGCGGVIRKTSAFKEAKVKDVKVKKGSQVKTEVDTSTAMGFCRPPKMVANIYVRPWLPNAIMYVQDMLTMSLSLVPRHVSQFFVINFHRIPKIPTSNKHYSEVHIFIKAVF